MRLCSFEGCGRPLQAKGLCVGHYRQQSLGKVLKPLHPQRFNRKDLAVWWMENKSERIGDCIVPITNQKRDYPQVRVQGRAVALSRLSYEAFVGPLQDMEVHHICANTRCFNPEHLQKVSHQANIAESKERRAYRLRISALEAALAELDPTHELLEGYSSIR